MHKQHMKSSSSRPHQAVKIPSETWIRNEPVKADNARSAIWHVAIDVDMLRQERHERVNVPANLAVNPMRRSWYEDFAAIRQAEI